MRYCNGMKRYHPLFALLVAACSSTPSTTATQCAEGQIYNPVAGRCQTASTPDPNNVTPDPDLGSGTTDGGTPPKPDTGTTAPDMATPPDLGPPAPDMSTPTEMMRFVAIGDQGTGSDMQIKVGLAMDTVCKSLGGCDFGLLLGDNVYDTGVSSADDILFMTTFEIPYGGLGFPFYAVLGNHDLGGDGLGVDRDQNKADYQIGYSDLNPLWIMPSRYYEFSKGPLHFVALDTTKIFFGDDDDQRRDVPQLIANAAGRWKIAFGHHPYYSNGKHGNAGEYDNVPFIPIANGENVRSFVEDRICGQVDFYICGHDHSRQDLIPDCQGTQFIVSGAGAKTTELGGSNGAHFESDVEGFLLIEATNTVFKIRFYDENGVMDHERTVTR